MNRCAFFFFFQAEDGIRDLVRSRGLGDVYKRQIEISARHILKARDRLNRILAKNTGQKLEKISQDVDRCLLYTSDAADERSSVDLGGRRIIKKKKRDKKCRANKKKDK